MASAPLHEPPSPLPRSTFAALRVRNFRLYFLGQLVSVSGTWMQSVAQIWLVLELTHSATALGVVIALQFAPMLVAGPWGGLVVDRSNKRRLLLATQSAGAGLALLLGCLTAFSTVTVPQIFGLALALGVVNVFDNPARQTFLQEMVGRDLLPNAVSLNSVLINLGRVVGPAIAGTVIAVFGVAECFFFNACSFAALLMALLLMDVGALTPLRSVAKAPGQVRAGLRYALATPEIRSVLISVFLIGILAFNFTVTLPLLAEVTFAGGAQLYGLFAASMGAGAVVGGVLTARRQQPTLRYLSVVAAAFGVLLIGVGLSPSPLVAALVLALMGAASISFLATANGLVQLASREEMRGRVMSLYALGFLGTTPIGAPLVGMLCGWTSPRVGLLLGGLAAIAAALPPLRAHARRATPVSGCWR